MWPRIVAGIFIPVGNHYFQALASTLQFVAQVCDRQWLVPATDRAFLWLRSAFAASTLEIVHVLVAATQSMRPQNNRDSHF